jgi:hypothetical protein
MKNQKIPGLFPSQGNLKNQIAFLATVTQRKSGGKKLNIKRSWVRFSVWAILKKLNYLLTCYDKKEEYMKINEKEKELMFASLSGQSEKTKLPF